MNNPRQSARNSGNFAIFASLLFLVIILVLIPVLIVVLHDPNLQTTTTTATTTTTTAATTTTATTTAALASTAVATTAVATTATTTTALTSTAAATTASTSTAAATTAASTTAASTGIPVIFTSFVTGVSNRVDHSSIDDTFVFAEYVIASPTDIRLRVVKENATTNERLWTISQSCLAVAPAYAYNFVTVEPITGNIYVATQCTNGTFIYKYTPSGLIIWEQNYGPYLFESQYSSARLEFDPTNSHFYIQQLRPSDIVIMKINANTGLATGTEVAMTNACSTLPNYVTGGRVTNLKYALGKIVTGERIELAAGELRTCIQTYNATTLVLESVYADNLPNATVPTNRGISIDVDKTNGDVYIFIYQAANAGWLSTGVYLSLLKYNAQNNFVYRQTFLNATYQLKDPNNGLPRPRSIIVQNSGIIHFLSQYVTSPSASTGFRMLLSVNMTTGAQLQLYSEYLDDLNLVATTPIWREANNAIYYMNELEYFLSEFPA